MPVIGRVQTMFYEELRDNWTVFRDINGLAGHSSTLDSAMRIGANDVIFALPLMLALAWLALTRWSPFARWLTARFGAEAAGRDRWLGQRALLSACIGVVLALCLNILVGTLLYEPRPFISHPGVVHLLIAHANDASFPSDHEAVSMAIALAFVFYLGWLLISTSARNAKISQRNANAEPSGMARLGRIAPALGGATLGVLLAVGIGFARVFVGVHYPLDIAGGAVCAGIGDALAFALIPMTQAVYRPVVRLAESVRLA